MQDRRIEGIAAIEAAEAGEPVILCSYTDPTEEGRAGLTVAEAREIAAQDPGLVYGVPAEIDGLEALRDAMRAADPRVMRGEEWRTDLPTYGGDTPDDTREVWSWDAGRLLVGTCASDLEIVAR